MKYKKPEIVATVNATAAIEGTKPDGAPDAQHPKEPPMSTGAYTSDE